MTGPISRVPSDRTKETTGEAEKFFGREVVGGRGGGGGGERGVAKKGIVLVRIRLMGVVEVRSGNAERDTIESG